jgi:Cu/Ag efflux protein CusF
MVVKQGVVAVELHAAPAALLTRISAARSIPGPAIIRRIDAAMKKRTCTGDLIALLPHLLS